MSFPVSQWSTSLTDRIIAALGEKDFGVATELAIKGDGRARDLGHEFHLMYKGLGITVRVIMRLLADEEYLTNTVRRRLLESFFDNYLETATRSLPHTSSLKQSKRDNNKELTPNNISDLLGLVETALEADQMTRADEIVESLIAGRDPGAELQAKINLGYRPIHDCLIDFMAEIFSSVVEEGGAKSLDAFQFAVAEGQRKGIDKWEEGGSQSMAAAFANLLVQHLGSFSVIEESDKYVFEQSLCGSGGRLIRDGRYEGEDALNVVKGPSELTAKQPTLPAYCTHCPIWNTYAPERWYGHPHVKFVDPARSGGACTLHVMKFDK